MTFARELHAGSGRRSRATVKLQQLTVAVSDAQSPDDDDDEGRSLSRKECTINVFVTKMLMI